MGRGPHLGEAGEARAVQAGKGGLRRDAHIATADATQQTEPSSFQGLTAKEQEETGTS